MVKLKLNVFSNVAEVAFCTNLIVTNTSPVMLFESPTFISSILNSSSWLGSLNLIVILSLVTELAHFADEIIVTSLIILVGLFAGILNPSMLNSLNEVSPLVEVKVIFTFNSPLNSLISPITSATNEVACKTYGMLFLKNLILL